MIRPLFCAFLLMPSISFAQATLAGVVRDSSNAVLPGVTIETSSPALIEKTRTATTDGTGQYQIVDLRPGTYAITFSLSGFRTIRREGVEISGAGVTTIDVELSLGGLAETLTVRGETPVVDVQSARRQAVLADTVVSQLPAARTYGAILAAIPALQGAGANPALDTNTNFFFTVHGGPANEGRVQLAGLGVGTAMNGNATSNAIDTANAREIQISISGALGEAEVGGPILNVVPATGGNAFHGSAFGSGAGTWAQANNLDSELRASGISEPAALIKLWDVSFAMGGPIRKDRLWFFGNVRDFGNHTGVQNLYANKYAGDAAHWDYAPDPSLKARTATSKTIASMRLTTQATPRNTFGFYYDYQWICDQASLSTTDGCRPRGADWVPGTIFGVWYLPRGRDKLLGRARHRLTGHLVVTGHQQAAARRRVCHLRQSLGVDAASWRHHESRPDDHARADVPGLSRDRQHLRQLAESEHVASLGDLRDRCPQREGRVSGRVSHRGDDRLRQRCALHPD